MIADPGGFCKASKEALGVGGVGVTLLRGGHLYGQIGASDDVAVGLEWTEFSLGEGPRAAAALGGAPVLDADISAAEPRYPLFAPAARLIGAKAIFTFPIASGPSMVGALSLYNRESGNLSRRQFVGASMLADLALFIILASAAKAPAGELPNELSHVGRDRLRVHQATGVIAEQLHISVADALSALRARAWETSRSLTEISTAVIERRLRLE